MNSFIASGRLTKDPDVRYSQDKKAVASFTIAIPKSYVRDGVRGADYMNCVAFGKNAEFVDKYIKKGVKVLIRGRMEQDDYTNKDGQKVYGWKCTIDEIDFGESKKDSGNAEPEQKEPEKDENGFMNIPDNLDDMPFN